MSNGGLSSGEALAFFIGGLILTAAGVGLLVRYLRRGRPKTAVDFYHRRQEIFISLAAIIFGSLSVTGGSYFYFAPDGPEWLRWTVGVLFLGECLGCFLFQKVVSDSWYSQLDSTRLEREHHELLHEDTDRPNGN